MSLIKLANGITDISGKFGGIVFGRDGSGLHARTLQSQRIPPETPAQKTQRDWYSSLKYAEHHNGPSEPEAEQDPTKRECQVFLLKRFWWLKGNSTSPSEVLPTTENAGIMDEIGVNVYRYWPQLKYIPHFTVDAAITLAAKLYWQTRTQLNATHEAAMAATFARLLAAAAFCVGVPAWAVATLAALVAAALFYRTYQVWNERIARTKFFGFGNCIANTTDGWYWASLYKRASNLMFDLRIISPMPTVPWIIRTDTKNPSFISCRFEYGLNYQEEIIGLIYNTIYTWDGISAGYLGNGYLTESGDYRIKLTRYHSYVRTTSPKWELSTSQIYEWVPALYTV